MGAVAASALIGRGDQLADLEAALERALAGSGSIALLVGDPGVGKTRLAAEIATSASRRGVKVLWGHSYEAEWSPPYGPWIEALSEYLRGAESEELVAELGSAASVLAELLPEIGDVPPPPELDPAEARYRLYEALVRLLALAEPLVLVLDDLHLADGASLAVLDHVGRSVQRRRLLVVGAYREHELELTHPLAQCVAELGRQAPTQLVRLPPLTREGTAALAESLAGAPLAQPVAEAIYAETEGNPFFVGELVHHLVEEGRDLAAGEDPAEWGIPESVRQAVGRRLSRLSPETNRVLAVSAAFTRPFDLAVLQALTEVDEDRLLASLDEALAAKMIRPARGEGERYEFVHPLVRHTLYEELSKSRQARLHRRIARALELVHADDDLEYATELAYQYHRSSALPGALRGLRYALAAAEQAEGAHAHAEAAAVLRIGLGLAAESEASVRADVLGRLALAEAAALQLGDSARTVNRTLAALAESGVGSSTVAAFLGEVAWALKDGGAGDDLLAPIVEAGLAAVGDRPNLAWARLMLIRIPVERKRAGALEYAVWRGFDPEAVELARSSGDELEYARTLEPLGTRTRADTDELAILVRGWTQPVAKIHGLTVVARALLYRHAAVRESKAVCEELVAASRAYGSPSGEAYAAVLLAEIEAALGDFAAARAATEEARRLIARLGPGHRLRRWRAGTGLLVSYVGGDWSSLARSNTELAYGSGGSWPWMSLVAAGGALAHARAGDAQAAERLLTVITPVIEEQEAAGRGQSEAVGEAASVVWELELLSYAERYRRLAIALIQEDVGDTLGSSSELTMARMSSLLGRDDEAERWFARARDTLGASGQRPLRAIVDYDEALAQARRGKPFADLLDVARAEFEALAMTFWLARANALAGDEESGLTHRESQVLRLVAAGRTNKEIAAELVLSVHTVERHLANVYSKIGARNRADATSYAIRHGLST